MIVVFLGAEIGDLVYLGVVHAKSICEGIKTLSYHGYSSSENVSLINSGSLVFFRLILDQGAYFRVRKFLWLGIF